MTGQKKTFGSGDINLSAAMLTMGVPPDARNPIELIARDNGKDYVRFHFDEVSFCGDYTPDALSYAWSNPRQFKAENPAHPFALLMDFIAARPNGCGNADEWQDHAAGFLALPIDEIRKTYRSIARTCLAAPESPLAYVCAFIRNRADLVAAAKQREANGVFTNMQDRSKSVSMINAKAPRRIRDFLLSHVR
jgi:hypothetical protein